MQARNFGGADGGGDDCCCCCCGCVVVVTRAKICASKTAYALATSSSSISITRCLSGAAWPSSSSSAFEGAADDAAVVGVDDDVGANGRPDEEEMEEALGQKFVANVV